MTTRVISLAEAQRVARRRFLAVGSLDMTALADDLAVSRATLYRVIGTHDRLLGDVLFDLGSRTLDAAITAVDGTDLRGVDRLLEISQRFERDVAAAPAFQRFLRTSPLVASRVLLTPAGRVLERMVGRWQELLEEALEAGELTLPFDPADFAYLYVRIGESLLYGDVLAGIEPDVEVATRVRRALFQAT